MTHPGFAKLQRYSLGELSTDERLSVDHHVQSCARCRKLVEEEQRLDEWVIGSLAGTPSRGEEEGARARRRAAGGGETSGPRVARRTRPSVAPLPPILAGPAEPQPARRTAGWWPLAAAAAALIAVVWWKAGPSSVAAPVEPTVVA